MAQMLTDVAPENLLGFKRAGFLVPADWECEAGVDGGVWPCPDGIPSVCRLTKRDAGWQAQPQYLTCVVHHYCQNTEYSEDVCCEYYQESDWNTTDDYYPASEYGAGTCSLQAMKDNLWGYEMWYDEPGRETHYINFDVNRMELGPTFGVQFYSSNDDTLKVNEDGVKFNPLNSKRYIHIKEDLVYEYGEAQESRRRLAENAKKSSSKDEIKAAHSAKPPEGMARFAGSCPPKRCPPQQKPQKTEPIETSTANGHANRPRRQLRRGGGGGALMTSGSFTLSSNRGGNS
jgi:hypothetical protein